MLTDKSTTAPLYTADLLFGADSLAAALGLTRRQVYHAVHCGRLPVFRIGSIICARRSTLTRWFDQQELAASMKLSSG